MSHVTEHQEFAWTAEKVGCPSKIYGHDAGIDVASPCRGNANATAFDAVCICFTSVRVACCNVVLTYRAKRGSGLAGLAGLAGHLIASRQGPAGGWGG